MTPDSQQHLSIVIAARNEADRVGETVRAVRGTFPAASVWVADDASSDGTAEVAMMAGAQVVSLGRPYVDGCDATDPVEASKRLAS